MSRCTALRGIILYSLSDISGLSGASAVINAGNMINGCCCMLLLSSFKYLEMHDTGVIIILPPTAKDQVLNVAEIQPSDCTDGKHGHFSA